jgi:lipopolysaccharide export system protein LptA
LRIVALVTGALVIATALSIGRVAAAEGPKTTFMPLLAPADPALPIDVDATFSEFDRRNNRLIFRQLKITQGALTIKADEATADPADFEKSIWVFVGNVSIENGGTQASCDRAELTFLDNRLRKGSLTGQPARFSQAGIRGNPPTKGRSQLIEYDLDAATIQLTTDANLSDGRSELSGNKIAYDLRREVVTAGGNQDGQVRMRITPQQKAAPAATKP